MRFRLPDSKYLIAGAAFGAVVGAWAGSKSRDFISQGEVPSLIDWQGARAFAARMNTQSRLDADTRAELNEYYATLVDEATPIVAEYTGMELPYHLTGVYAFDRIDWVDANVVNFQSLFEPIEQLNPLRQDPNASSFNLAWGTVNQRILTAEIGLLLGYLGRRVLGQYDMTLLGREPVEGGRLYFVHPNIQNVEKNLRLPSQDFRLWLALHEVTHAFEFEANPWLQEHFNGLLKEYISFLNKDAEHLKRGMDGLKIFWRRAKNGESISGNWFEYVMNKEQRDLFNRMQALMSVVEGYSNHVMNAVGRELIPSYEVISRRFERRLRQRTMVEVLFARITGLDVKMEQYRKGEAFIEALVAEGGHDFAKRVWEGPEMIPGIEEIDDPQLWIDRVRAGVST
ncbi:MAG: hypothetical protein EA415_08885 [Sphaerobacteraceae bacterium]|nr:MAG: hypothetical protein EA415_08885 [Sphaerobacteraceae bacterium]